MPNQTIPAPPPLATAARSGLVSTTTQTLAGQKTFQNKLVLGTSIQFANASIQTIAYPYSAASTFPVAGSHAQGEIVFNSLPSLGEPAGWICVDTGTPGVWQPFGAITNPTVFDVKDYGAIGDDSNNDTTSIEAAVAAAAVNGGEVLFPTGVYLITAQITIPQNVNVRGSGTNRFGVSGKGTVIHHSPPAPDTDCLYFERDPGGNYAENRVSDFTLLGEANSRHGLRMEAGWSQVSQVTIRDFAGAGLYLSGMINSTFDTVVVANCDYGLLFDPSVLSTSTSFKSCYFSGNRVGSLVQNCNSTSFSDWCIWESSIEDALLIESSTVLTDPYFENNTRCLIKIGQTSTVEQVAIRGGIYVGGAGADATYDSIYVDKCKRLEGSIHDMRLSKACHLRTTVNTLATYWFSPDNIQAASGAARANNTLYSKGTVLNVVCDDLSTRTFIVKVAGTTAGAKPAGYTRTVEDLTDGTAVLTSYGVLIPYDWSNVIVVQDKDDFNSINGAHRFQYEDHRWNMHSSFFYTPGELFIEKAGGSEPVLYARPDNDKIAFQTKVVSTTQGAKFGNGLEVAGNLVVTGAISEPGVFNVKYYGAIGDGSANDEPAIALAIAAAGVGGEVFFPKGTYKVNATLLPLANQTWKGLGSPSSQIIVNHDGVGIYVDTKNSVKFQGIGVLSTGAHINVTASGFKLKASNYCRFDDVSVHYCDTGIHLFNECDWTNSTGLLIAYCENYGIRIQSDGGSVGANNNFAFTSINLNSATPGKNTYGIQTDGGVNLFTGGEISLCRWPVGFSGTNNRLLGAYVESTEFGPKLTEGTHYFDSHFASGVASIAASAKLVGPSGREVSQWADFQQQRLSFAGLKALHLFNEGFGRVLQDLSGNGNNFLTVATPTWNQDGMWGPGLLFDYGNTEGAGNYPLTAHTWTAPFTIAALTRVDSIPANPGNAPILIEFYQAGKYFRVVRTESTAQAQNYDGATLTSQGWGTSAFVAGDGKWAWTIFYVDPGSNEITALDPIYGATAAVALPCNALTGVTEIHLGYSAGPGYYSVGRYGYLGVWDRKLSMSEVYDLVNSKVAQVPLKPVVDSSLVSALVSGDGSEIRFDAGSAAPVTGTWPYGWIRYNNAPIAGGNLGWVCTVAGTPGTWKEWGIISI
jgi:hypothetical protein